MAERVPQYRYSATFNAVNEPPRNPSFRGSKYEEEATQGIPHYYDDHGWTDAEALQGMQNITERIVQKHRIDLENSPSYRRPEIEFAFCAEEATARDWRQKNREIRAGRLVAPHLVVPDNLVGFYVGNAYRIGHPSALHTGRSGGITPQGSEVRADKLYACEPIGTVGLQAPRR